MLVYLALSSHGFGHAARQSAVLAALRALHPHWRLVVAPRWIMFLNLVFQGCLLNGVPSAGTWA